MAFSQFCFILHVDVSDRVDPKECRHFCFVKLVGQKHCAVKKSIDSKSCGSFLIQRRFPSDFLFSFFCHFYFSVCILCKVLQSGRENCDASEICCRVSDQTRNFIEHKLPNREKSHLTFDQEFHIWIFPQFSELCTSFFCSHFKQKNSLSLIPIHTIDKIRFS